MEADDRGATALSKMSKQNLIEEVKRLRIQNEMLLTTIERISKTAPVNEEGSSVVIGAMRTMTKKQHAALQMILYGAANQQIAGRFSIAESTAKVYVRGFMKHLGVHNRTQAALMVKPVFDNLSDADYESMSGGLPKDWHINFETKYRKGFDDMFA